MSDVIKLETNTEMRPVPEPIIRPCEWGLQGVIMDLETQLGSIEAYNMLVSYANRLKEKIDMGQGKQQNPYYSTHPRNMIHINHGDDPHEILTKEEFSEKYPDAVALSSRPRPFKNFGYQLKKIRMKSRTVVRVVADKTGLKPSEICNIEDGRILPDISVYEFYSNLTIKK